MEKTQIIRIIFVLAICGVLFSGYLSYTKLISHTCALNEQCSTLLGIPTCVYGLILYIILLIASGLLVFSKTAKERCLGQILIWVSLAGILFSGFFTVKELLPCIAGSCAYGLVLPTCSYGLIMYIAIHILAFKAFGCCCCGKMACKAAPIKIVGPPAYKAPEKPKTSKKARRPKKK